MLISRDDPDHEPWRESQRRIESGISEARFPIADWRELGDLRVTVPDETGGRAWTTPFWS